MKILAAIIAVVALLAMFVCAMLAIWVYWPGALLIARIVVTALIALGYAAVLSAASD